MNQSPPVAWRPIRGAVHQPGAHLTASPVRPRARRREPQRSGGTRADPALQPFLSELAAEGITYRLITRSGCLKQQIIDYTDSEKEILFAVIESPSSLDADCDKQDKELSELWRKLKCPLVVVMDGAKA